MFYQKKPVTVEARKFIGAHNAALDYVSWMREYGTAAVMHCPETCELGKSDVHYAHRITIPTLEGDMIASPGDYIIRGVADGFYPRKPSVFEKTYERVADDEREVEGSIKAQALREAADCLDREDRAAGILEPEVAGLDAYRLRQRADAIEAGGEL